MGLGVCRDLTAWLNSWRMQMKNYTLGVNKFRTVAISIATSLCIIYAGGASSQSAAATSWVNKSVQSAAKAKAPVVRKEKKPKTSDHQPPNQVPNYR